MKVDPAPASRPLGLFGWPFARSVDVLDANRNFRGFDMSETMG